MELEEENPSKTNGSGRTILHYDEKEWNVMPKNIAESSFVALDIEKKCVCPFCGRKSPLNRLLFRTNQRLPAGTDFVLDKYQMDYGLTDSKAPYELATTMEPAVLFDWRSCDALDMQIDQGIITSVTNYYGKEYKARACPFCHNELPIWVYTLPSMICFSQNASDVGILVNPSEELKFNTFAGKMIIRREGKWACYVLDSEEPAVLVHRRREANLCHEADRMIIVCRVDENAGEAGSIDQETQVWMRNLLLLRFSNQNVGCKTLVIIRTEKAIGIDELKSKHGVLYAHINAHFPVNKIVFWQNGQKSTTEIEQEIEWLIKEN